MKKIITVVLSALLVFSCAAFPVGAAESEANTNYPYIFVHGMMGWGSYDGVDSLVPYWGVFHGDMLADLQSQGYECYSASVGKLSSNWDRSCELYAQLTGTRVDYGEVHSARHFHARYGRSYENAPLMQGWGDIDESGNIRKINLFGHSLGGPTVRLFAYLMANGAPEEAAASGDGVSPLFEGGKADWIYSVTTWSAPHNGAPFANPMYDKFGAGYMLAFMANIIGASPMASFWDFQLEQFGLTRVKSEGVKAHFNPDGIKKFVKSDDNCGYDLSIRGAQAMNDSIDIVPDIYYFSYTGEKDRKLSNGIYVPTIDMSPMLVVSAFATGRLSGVCDGVSLGEEWRPNDGIVPVISARAPFDEPVVDYTEGAVVEKGVWNFMPVINGMSHVGYMGMDTNDYQQYYEYQMSLINSLGQ